MNTNYKLQLSVQEPFLTFIKKGQKTVEGRLAKDKYCNLKIGDIIKINDILLKVTSISKYKTFKEMLINEGLNNVIPNAKSTKEGTDVYYKFYSPKDEKLFGVVGIGIKIISSCKASQHGV